MQRRGAAEGDQGAAGDVGAALDRVHAGGVRHVLVHDLGDTVGGADRVEAQRLADPRRQHLGRLLGVELDGAAGEVHGIDLAERDVAVGDCRFRATAAVAGGAGLGTGAARSDLDARQRVDRGDRAAAGADLHHLDHRDAHRQAAALQEAGGAVDLEGARLERLAVVDQADLGGGAAHVEGEDGILGALGGDMRGEDRAAGRAGFDEAHRELHGGREAGETAA